MSSRLYRGWGCFVLALKTSKQTVERFAFSADGRYLAVAGSSWKVHLWDLAAKRLKAQTLPTLTGGTGAPGCQFDWLGFLPNGQLFSLSAMGEYVVHDPATGKTAQATLGRGRVGETAAEADCSAFYSTGWETRKWRFDGRKLHEVWNFKVQGHLRGGRGGSVLMPDGTLVSAVSNGSNRTWLHARDSTTGELRGQHHGANSLIRDLTLLADGKTLAFVREQEYCGPTRNAIMVGTVGSKFEPLVMVKKQGEKLYTSLALHPSGKWLAVGQADGVVRIFDTATWKEMVAYEWPVKPIEGVAFAPDGLKAAAGGEDGKFVVWDLDL